MTLRQLHVIDGLRAAGFEVSFPYQHGAATAKGTAETDEAIIHLQIEPHGRTQVKSVEWKPTERAEP